MSKTRRSLGKLWKLRIAARTMNGAPFTIVSMPSRQQERAKDRQASLETVNQHYGPEPRKARRKIARAWAKKLMIDRRKAAEYRRLERDRRQRLQEPAA
jgi:hypothetical protein